MPFDQSACNDWVSGVRVNALGPMRLLHRRIQCCRGNPQGSRLPTMTTDVTPASIPLELLEDTLLVQQDLITRLTVLALEASANPERSPRVRALLAYLLDAVEFCEEELGTYAALDARRSRITALGSPVIASR